MKWLKPLAILLVVALLTANLALTWQLNQTMASSLRQLSSAQNNIQKSLEATQQQLSTMNGNMEAEFDRQASLFSESSSVVSYSPEGLVVTTTLTPKELSTDSKITVTSVSNGKSFPKEAVQNGSEFSAVSVVPFCETVEISAAISSGESIQQENLPSIPCQTVLAFDIYSHYEYGEQLLYFTVSNPQSADLLDSLKSIHLSVLRDGAVVGAIYPEKVELSSLPDAMKGNSNCLAYSADLSPYLSLEGELQIVPKINSTTGLSYAEDVLFSFIGTANGVDSYQSGDSWYPPLFH